MSDNAFAYFRSPNDSPRDGTIHPMAMEQLEQWRALAKDWPVYDAEDHGRKCVRCRKCEQCLWFRTDRSGNAYAYTPQMKEALVTSHIRQAHAEVGSDID